MNPKLTCTRTSDAEIEKIILALCYHGQWFQIELDLPDLEDHAHAGETFSIKLNFSQDWSGCLTLEEIMKESHALSTQLAIASWFDENHMASVEDYTDDGESFWDIYPNDDFMYALANAYVLLEDQKNMYETEIEIF